MSTNHDKVNEAVNNHYFDDASAKDITHFSFNFVDASPSPFGENTFFQIKIDEIRVDPMRKCFWLGRGVLFTVLVLEIDRYIGLPIFSRYLSILP